jgi:hypothetical protein
VVVNKPNGDSRLQDALDGLPKLGIRAYWVSGLSESPPNFELAGLGTMANIAGLTFVDRPRLAADVVAVITRGVRPDDPPPCAWIAGHGVGAPAVYLARGPVTTKKLTDVIYGAPVRDLNLVCPSRS